MQNAEYVSRMMQIYRDPNREKWGSMGGAYKQSAGIKKLFAAIRKKEQAQLTKSSMAKFLRAVKARAAPKRKTVAQLLREYDTIYSRATKPKRKTPAQLLREYDTQFTKTRAKTRAKRKTPAQLLREYDTISRQNLLKKDLKQLSRHKYDIMEEYENEDNSEEDFEDLEIEDRIYRLIQILNEHGYHNILLNLALNIQAPTIPIWRKIKNGTATNKEVTYYLTTIMPEYLTSDDQITILDYLENLVTKPK
jgi:hypothetical protein